MKLSYFSDTDTLYIELQGDLVAETRDFDEDTLVDLDAAGKLVAITIENASQRADVRRLTLHGMNETADGLVMDCKHAAENTKSFLEDRKRVGFVSNQRKRFVDWMRDDRSRRLKKSTADFYASEIENYLSNLAGRPLLDIKSPAEFEAIDTNIRKKEIFVEANRVGHGRLSAALNCYSQFLRVQATSAKWHQ